MAREQEPVPHKTSYEIIKDLYEKSDVKALPGDTKIFTLENDSSISIGRYYAGDIYWFWVGMDNILRYNLNPEGLVNGLIDEFSLSLVLEIGNFKNLIVDYDEQLISMPKKHNRDVGLILANWTERSIREGKLSEPPFKLTISFPKKQVGKL